jgi:excisionase family DNA binding protein
MSDRPCFYVTSEVADLLRVRERTIRRWGRTGVLPAARLGRRWLFSRTAVEAALARQADAQAVEESAR